MAAAAWQATVAGPICFQPFCHHGGCASSPLRCRFIRKNIHRVASAVLLSRSWEHGLLVSVSIAVAALADCSSQRLAQPSLQSKSIKLFAHWPGPAPWAIMGRCFKHRRQGPPSKSGVEHLPGVQLNIENAMHWAFWVGFLRQGGLAHQLRNIYV